MTLTITSLSIYLSKIGEIVIQMYIFNEFKKLMRK